MKQSRGRRDPRPKFLYQDLQVVFGAEEPCLDVEMMLRCDVRPLGLEIR